MWNLTTDLRFINEPEPNFEYFCVIRIIAGIQLIPEILTILHVIYVLRLFIRNRVCHIHFRILTSVFLIDVILKAVANIIILVKHLTGFTFVSSSRGYFVLNVIQNITNYAYFTLPLSIFIERTVSLFMAKKYERFYSKSLIAACLLQSFINAGYNALHLFFLQSWFPLLTMYAISDAYLILIWIIYFVVYFCSTKPNKIHIQTVSERFQRFENSQTHKTMYWVAGSSILSLSLVAVYVIFMMNYQKWFPNISEMNMIAMCRIIFDACQAYILLFVPAAFACNNAKMKKQYLKIFSRFKAQSPIESVTLELQIIKSISGQNMVFRNEQEQYFNSLKNDWNAKLDQQSS